MKTILPQLAILVLAACSATPSATTPRTGDAVAGEHAGKGAEHAGKAAAKITAEDIKAAMTNHIDAATKEGGGVLEIRDEVADEDLRLEFVKIHDPVRKIEGKGYFACTDFHPTGAPEGKLYDLDFWLDLQSGKLVVTETRIHKHPKAEGGGWMKEARYTFVDDQPVVVE